MKQLLLSLIPILFLLKNASAQYWSAVGEGVGHPDRFFVPTYDNTTDGYDVFGPSVASLCFYKGELYAGGYFDFANGFVNNIAKWNGTSWSPVGDGVYTLGGSGYYDSWVKTLLVHNGELYVGGRFTQAGDIQVNNIAKWNGTEWSAVGDGLGNYGYSVSSLVVHDGALYAGGHFYNSGAIPLKNIAKWDGTRWSALGTGIDVYEKTYPYGAVNSMVIHNGELYAGGHFDTTLIVGKGHIVKWDGTSWFDVGTGIQDAVSCLASFNGELYAGGAFADLKKWNGIDWLPLNSGVKGYIHCLLVQDKWLFAGGNFDTAGQVVTKSVAKWNGAKWSAFKKGVKGYVSCMASDKADLIVGGDFDMAEEVWTNRIAKWTERCTSSPDTPGNIIGGANVCQSRHAAFYIDEVTDAADFTWTLPAGWSGSSASNRILILAGTNSGTISVTANNPCGSSRPRIIAVNAIDTVSEQLDSIVGSTVACPNSIQTYSIKHISSATLYEWILPRGWEGFSKTNTISVKTGTAGGVISVWARNHCSSSKARTLSVTVDDAYSNGPSIMGSDTVKRGQTTSYSVSAVASAAYSWSLNGGGKIISGTNSTSVTVDWLNVGNYVLSVKINGCGAIREQTKVITVSGLANPSTAMNSDSTFEIAILPNPSFGSFYLKTKAVENTLIRIEVFSMMGRKVRPTIQMRGSAISSCIINLENLPPGNYLVTFTVNDQVYVKKISKTK